MVWLKAAFLSTLLLAGLGLTAWGFNMMPTNPEIQVGPLFVLTTIMVKYLH